jgi:hypothetical protein
VGEFGDKTTTEVKTNANLAISIGTNHSHPQNSELLKEDS